MYLLMLLGLTAGAVLPIQAAVNARLGRELGNPMLGALGSFVSGSVMLLIYLLVTRTSFPAPGLIARVPAFLWLGGVLGGIWVTLAIILTPKMGVATTIGLAVAGQIGMSIVLDHFGLLGLDKHPVSVGRIVGALFLAAGVVLVKRF